jgi:hypothetical protein
MQGLDKASDRRDCSCLLLAALTETTLDPAVVVGCSCTRAATTGACSKRRGHRLDWTAYHGQKPGARESGPATRQALRGGKGTKNQSG